MAKIDESLKIVMWLEYSNKVSKALEVNETETGMTYKGIYQTAHPKWEGWDVVREALEKTDGSKSKAAELLEADVELQEAVAEFYKREFWDKMRLDEVQSQKIADEMMVFGVNTHPKTAVRVAQRVVGVLQDGAIGPKTLKALNEFDADVFSETFDELEKAHYAKIVANRPEKGIFLKGWRNRAVAV